MEAPDIYRTSTIGQALEETLDELIRRGKIDKDYKEIVMKDFDREIY